MRCNISGTSESVNRSPKPTFNQSIAFLESTILCTNSANVKVSFDNPLYSRSSVTAWLTLGIKQPLSLFMGKYTQCKVIGEGEAPTILFRTGTPNSTDTKINSPTILVSGKSPLAVKRDETEVYFVLGSVLEAPIHNSSQKTGDLNLSNVYEISEIYLE